jgi:acid phosphatase
MDTSKNSAIPDSPAMVPPGLTLKKVQIIHRHGERTHVTPRIAEFLPPETRRELYEEGCRLVAKLHQNIIKAGVEQQSHHEKFPIHERDAIIAPSIRSVDIAGVSTAMEKLYEQMGRGHCGLGQLTDVGKDTMNKLGSFFRRQYIDRHKLLPEKMDETQIKLRSTDYARTFESLQYVLSGLYGEHAPNGLHISTRVENEESLHALENHCPRLKQLMAGFRKAVKEEFKPRLDEFGEKYKHYLPADEKRRTNAYAIHDM